MILTGHFYVFGQALCCAIYVEDTPSTSTLSDNCMLCALTMIGC